MPKLFGLEPKIWIPLAGVAGVGLIYLFLKSRQGGGDTSAAGPDNTFGAGAVAPSAPAQSPAATSPQESFGDQLAQLQAQILGEQLREQRAAFDLQQQAGQTQLGLQTQIANALLPSEIQLQRSQTKAMTDVFNKGISCPGKASARIGPNGEIFCRQKTAGSILGLPIGQIFDSVSNLLTGVQAAAPAAGAQLTQAAAGYYGGQIAGGGIGGLFGSRGPVSYRDAGITPQTPYSPGGLALNQPSQPVVKGSSGLGQEPNQLSGGFLRPQPFA
jgi:hypothetical protein